MQTIRGLQPRTAVSAYHARPDRPDGPFICIDDRQTIRPVYRDCPYFVSSRLVPNRFTRPSQVGSRHGRQIKPQLMAFLPEGLATVTPLRKARLPQTHIAF